jgi:hypothetical protein
MMYDREKSDLAIVAVKPTNKAGKPAAELVEPPDFRGRWNRLHHESKGRKGRASRSQRLARAKERPALLSRRASGLPLRCETTGPPGTKRSRCDRGRLSPYRAAWL